MIELLIEEEELQAESVWIGRGRGSAVAIPLGYILGGNKVSQTIDRQINTCKSQAVYDCGHCQ